MTADHSWIDVPVLDHESPAKPGGDGVSSVAAIGREIAYNDHQGDRAARGGRQDRNVILPTDRPPPSP